MATPATTATTAKAGAGLVLAVLASSQFLMTLDSSVMNVSMPVVASDLGTTITGIQTAITLYTLVMATLMITGGKLGTIMGRRKAMGIGLVIYAAGSFTTGIAQNLTQLLIGWSLLEGIGAALIMPAIVALVASNFPPEKRAAAYGLVAAAGAVAVAAGPLIGGAVTTYASWRYVFFGEVVIVLAILAVLRKVRDVAPQPSRIDLIGSLLSIIGLGLLVFIHELGHFTVSLALGMRPLLDLGLRLGEGTGAILAAELVRHAVRLERDMATFSTAGVADRSRR